VPLGPPKLVVRCTGFRLARARTRPTRERGGLGPGGGCWLADALCELTLIASICPPEFGRACAEHVTAAGFRGTYRDANALSPARQGNDLAKGMASAGIRFVDGGISVCRLQDLARRG